MNCLEQVGGEPDQESSFEISVRWQNLKVCRFIFLFTFVDLVFLQGSKFRSNANACLAENRLSAMSVSFLILSALISAMLNVAPTFNFTDEQQILGLQRHTGKTIFRTRRSTCCPTPSKAPCTRMFTDSMFRALLHRKMFISSITRLGSKTALNWPGKRNK